MGGGRMKEIPEYGKIVIGTSQRKGGLRIFGVVGDKLLVGTEVWIKMSLLDMDPFISAGGPRRSTSLGNIVPYWIY